MARPDPQAHRRVQPADRIGSGPLTSTRRARRRRRVRAAGFRELDLSARWRIYSCFGRASLADLDPPGFPLARVQLCHCDTDRRDEHGNSRTRSRAVGMGIYRTLPAGGYDRGDRDATGRDCGDRCRSAHARCMDARSIVAAGDHANRALSMRGSGGGLSPRREPQKRQATLRRSATVPPSGSMSTDLSRVMARSR